MILAPHTSESANKVFLAPNHVGISVCNEVSVNGKTISGYLNSFLVGSVTESTPVETVPQMLLDHMRQLAPVPNTIFSCGGIREEEQSLCGSGLASLSRKKQN